MSRTTPPPTMTTAVVQVAETERHDEVEARRRARGDDIGTGARVPSRRPDRRTIGVTPTAAAKRQALERAAGAGATEAEPLAETVGGAVGLLTQDALFSAIW